MRLESEELGLAVEFTIDHDIDIVAKVIAFAIAGNLEPASMGDRCERDSPSTIWSM